MDRILIILKKENGPRASSAPALGLNTIIFKHVYWYMQQISGERLQDHWSSGWFSTRLLKDKYQHDLYCLQCSKATNQSHDVVEKGKCNSKKKKKKKKKKITLKRVQEGLVVEYRSPDLSNRSKLQIRTEDYKNDMIKWIEILGLMPTSAL